MEQSSSFVTYQPFQLYLLYQEIQLHKLLHNGEEDKKKKKKKELSPSRERRTWRKRNNLWDRHVQTINSVNDKIRNSKEDKTSITRSIARLGGGTTESHGETRWQHLHLQHRSGETHNGKRVRAHDIPHHLINGGDFGILEGIPENWREVQTRHPLTRHIYAVQFDHSAHRTVNALGSRLKFKTKRDLQASLCPKMSVVIWCVTCLIRGCSLTRIPPWALPLLHLPILPHNEYTQYIPHISKLSQSTSCAIKNHSGVKTCRVVETRATTPTKKRENGSTTQWRWEEGSTTEHHPKREGTEKGTFTFTPFFVFSYFSFLFLTFLLYFLIFSKKYFFSFFHVFFDFVFLFLLLKFLKLFTFWPLTCWPFYSFTFLRFYSFTSLLFNFLLSLLFSYLFPFFYFWDFFHFLKNLKKWGKNMLDGYCDPRGVTST